MAVIKRLRDRAGREVVLTEARWAHILREHNELAGRRAEIRATVELPEFVSADADNAHRENHYRRLGPNEPFLKVVVHYRPVPPQGTWEGEVITAHQVGTRRVKRREQQLWP